MAEYRDRCSRPRLAALHRDAGRAHGALRRLCHAGAVPRRHHGRTPALPRQAALFDVSHMGQAELVGEGAAAALERVTPADVQGLKPGRQRYGLLTTEAGGIFDDFMVANLGDRLFLVVNASRKARGLRRYRGRAARRRDAAAAAGPRAAGAAGAAAAAAIAPLAPGSPRCPSWASARGDDRRRPGHRLSRSGYTGEDGFEISRPRRPGRGAWPARCSALPGVQPAGLGARDSLRLEAGLCLYGNDIDETDQPGRGRADLDHRQAPPHGLELPGRRARARRTGQRRRSASASASGPKAASRPAAIRRSTRPAAPRSARSPPAASAPR